jgi:hypothetical protein
MQKRFFDRGVTYDHLTWRYFFGGMFKVGPHRGFELSVNSSGNIVLGGTTHTESTPGAVLLSSGLAVTEDSSVTVSYSVPASSSTKTLVITHTDNLLIRGTSATYELRDGELTDHPSDGAILGWVRYDGTGSLQDYMLVPYPTIGENVELLRSPIDKSPPSPVGISSDTGSEVTTGVDTTSRTKAWWGAQNPSTAGTVVSTAWIGWLNRSRPHQIELDYFCDGTGSQLTVELYDTSGTLVATTVLINGTDFATATLSVPAGTGTWAEGETAGIKLSLSTPQGTAVRIARVTIDNWPYPVDRV